MARVQPTTPPSPPVAASGPATPPSTGPASAATDDDLAALLWELTDDAANLPTVGAPLTKPTDVERPERAAVANIDSAGGLDFDPELASYGARLVGLVIDSLVVLLATMPGFVLVAVGSTPLIVVGALLMVVGFAVTTTLYARAVSSTGQWIGNRITNTKVVDARHGRTVSAGEAGARFLVRFLVSSILFVGFLVALGNSQRRTFHDNVAGTVVTRPPRARWSIDDEAIDG